MSLPDYQPESYHALLEAKAENLQAALAPFYQQPLTVFASPPSGFRMRAEFRFWHQGDDAWYAMFQPGRPDRPVRIDDFPIAHPRINALMHTLRTIVLGEPLLKDKLFQVEFLTGLSGDSLVTLVYHKRLDDLWQQRAVQLEKELGCAVIGRSRKQRLVISRDFIHERLSVNGAELHYQQVENSFTQPNAFINQHMLGWAQQHSAATPQRDLLELYCGNGNFTTALADNFRRVLATEISKTSVRSAQYNFSANRVENCQVVRMSSEDFTTALNGERTFRRLQAQAIDLADYDFSTVLVDPPRAGLDPETLALLARFDRILYISCNPATLLDNLATLYRSHDVCQAALFDQFPYTRHVETGLLLVKR